MILVTGGTGFLGTHLLRALVREGQPVRALRRSSSRILLEPEFSSQVKWVTGDVLDVSSLEEAMDGCAAVFHCAAFVSFFPRDFRQLMQVNVEGTANVVNAALEKKVNKLLHVSSVSAIGRNRSGTSSESTPWDQGQWNSNYGISKHLAEMEVHRGIAEGLQAIIVNPSLMIGSGNWQQGTPQFFNRIWKGLRYYTNNVSGMVAVEDVVQAMMQLMKLDANGARFIVSADNWSFKQLFDAIADALGKNKPDMLIHPWMMQLLWRAEMLKYRITGCPPLVTKETARIASGDSLYDHGKLVQATGFQFTSLPNCIEATAKKFIADTAAH